MRYILFFCLLATHSLALLAAPVQIIGEDDRVQVGSAAGVYASIGQLESANSRCTATIIGPRHILTNGHCVVEDRDEIPMQLKNPNDLLFYQGRTSENVYSGFARGSKIFTFRGWVRKGSELYDVAVVVLDRDLPASPIDLEEPNRRTLRQAELFVTGYSKDTPSGTLWEGKGSLVTVTNGDQKILHNVDTMPGTSGALIRRKVGQRWVGVGVHVGSSSYFLRPVNHGVLFNRTVLSAIRRWVSQN